MKNHNILFALLIFVLGISACKTKQVSTTPYSTIYQHEQFQIDVITGWTALDAEFSNALNIVKGPYILYINPNFNPLFDNPLQAIATGAPGADLFWETNFNANCANSKDKSMGNGLTRKNFFTFPSSNECKTTGDGESHWFFAYVYGASDSYTVKPGEINAATPGQGQKVVITMTAKPGDNLPMLTDMPLANDKELKKHLADMSEMVQTIKFK